MKTPPIDEIVSLCQQLQCSLRCDITKACDNVLRNATASDRDELLGELSNALDDVNFDIELTVGADCRCRWNYQTGDNSYTGGAYGFPYWGNTHIYLDSYCNKLAADIIEQLEEAAI
jgi:hypothetical protein